MAKKKRKTWGKPSKYLYRDLTKVFTHEQYKDYLYITTTSTLICALSENEKRIVYCHYKLGWGRKRIRAVLGLSKRYFYKVKEKIQGLGRIEEDEQRSLEQGREYAPEYYGAHSPDQD